MGDANFSSAAMRAFRERYRLSPELDNLAAAGRVGDFWRGAALELKRRYTNAIYEFERRFASEFAHYHQLEGEMKSLGCFKLGFFDPPRPPPPLVAAPPPETAGPEPVVRRPDGQPLMTEALITRWLRAVYAEAHTGGAFWQAGRMTSQADYEEVNARIALGYNARLSQVDFTADELAAFRARWADIDNAMRKNWSEVRIP
jgi:hypothetical protein